MAFKIFAGLVAVILIGLAMMLVDLWQSLKSKDD